MGIKKVATLCFCCFSSMVTDTNAQDQHPITILLTQQSFMFTLFSGLRVRCLTGGFRLGISLCIFLKIVEAMGLARGTGVDYLPTRFSL
jgi:hypothetical protein